MQKKKNWYFQPYRYYKQYHIRNAESDQIRGNTLTVTNTFILDPIYTYWNTIRIAIREVKKAYIQGTYNRLFGRISRDQEKKQKYSVDLTKTAGRKRT